MSLGGRFLARRRPEKARLDVSTPESLDLVGAMARAYAERMAWEHVVVYVDHVTGCTNAAGPFRDVVEACGFANRVGDELGLDGTGGVTVVPLHAADR